MANSNRVIGLSINIDPQDVAAIQQLVTNLNNLRSSVNNATGGGGAGGGVPPGGSGAAGAGGSAAQSAAQQQSQRTQAHQQEAKQAQNVLDLLGKIGLAWQGIQGIQAGLQASMGGFYNSMIGANERLNQEILKTQANLAATSKVILNGQTLKGIESVRATASTLQDALKTLEIETLSLVGVTSQDVNGVFNTVLSNVSAITGQSKEYENAIKASIPLAKSMTAAIGVMGMRLDEVGQEFGSLVKAEITEDSRLAKSLGINNAMVRQWRAQGKAVDEILARLEPFVDSNALAARSIMGIKSNIEDIVQILAREMGRPLLEPIIKGLQATFKLLNDNKEQIISFGEGFGLQIGAIAESIQRNLGPSISMLVAAGANFGQALGDVFRSLFEVVRNLIPALQPAAEAISNIVLQVSRFANTEFGRFLIKGFLLKMAADNAIGAISSQVGGLAKQLGTLADLAADGKVFSLFQAMGAKDGMARGLAGAFGTGSDILAAKRGAAIGKAGAKMGAGARAGGAIGQAIGAATTKAATGLSAIVPLLQTIGTTLVGLLPVILAVGAALGAVFIAMKTNEMRQSNEYFDRQSESADRASEANFRLANRIKQLTEIRDHQRDLTAAETKELEELQRQNNANAEVVQVRIDKAKEHLATLSDSKARSTQEAFIAGLEREYEALSSFNTLDVSFKDLLDLGPIAEQLSFQIEGAFQKVREGVQTSDELANYYKTILEMSQQQFAAGLINADEYKTRLEQVTADTRLPLETLKEAQKQLTAVDATIQQQQEKSADAAIQELERQMTLGQLGGVEGAQMVAEARIKKLQDKMDSLKKQLDEQALEISRLLGEEKTKLQLSIAEKRDAQSAGKGGTKTEIDAAKKQKAEAEGTIALNQAAIDAKVDVALGASKDKKVTQFMSDREKMAGLMAMSKGAVGSEAYNAEVNRLSGLSPEDFVAESQSANITRGQWAGAYGAGIIGAMDSLSGLRGSLQSGLGAVQKEAAYLGQNLPSVQGEQGAIQTAQAALDTANANLGKYEAPTNDQKAALDASIAADEARLADIEETEGILDRANAARDRLHELYMEGGSSEEFDAAATEMASALADLQAKTAEELDPAKAEEYRQVASELAQAQAEMPLQIAQATIDRMEREMAAVMGKFRTEQAELEAEIIAAQQAGTMGEGQAAELRVDKQKEQLALSEKQARDRLAFLRKTYSEQRALTASEQAEQDQRIQEAETALAEATAQRMDYASASAMEISEGYIAELERGQTQAMGVLRKAQAEREAVITEMFHGFQILESEAQGERLRMQRDMLEQELTHARDRVAVLRQQYEENPALDPQRRAQQLQALNDAEIRSTELVKELLDNEGALTDNIVAQEKERLDILERRVEVEKQLLGQDAAKELSLLERKAKFHEMITKQLNTQVELFRAQVELANIQSGATGASGALQVLEKTARTERERKQMAETRALLEVEMAEKRYQIELASLQLQKQQNELALIRKEIEAKQTLEAAKNERRSAQQERYSLMQRRAMIERDGTISEESRKLQLDEIDLNIFNNQMRLDSSEGALAGAAAGMQLLGLERQLTNAQFATQEASLKQQAGLEVLNARAAYADTLGARGRGVQSEVRRDAQEMLADMLGLDSRMGLQMGLHGYRQGGLRLYGPMGRGARQRGMNPEDLGWGAADLYNEGMIDRAIRTMPQGTLDLESAQAIGSRMVAEIDAEMLDAIARSELQHRPVARDGDTERGGVVSTQIDEFFNRGQGVMGWQTGVAGGYGEGVRSVEDIMGTQGPIPPAAAEQLSDIIRGSISGDVRVQGAITPEAAREIQTIMTDNNITQATEIPAAAAQQIRDVLQKAEEERAARIEGQEQGVLTEQEKVDRWKGSVSDQLKKIEHNTWLTSEMTQEGAQRESASGAAPAGTPASNEDLYYHNSPDGRQTDEARALAQELLRLGESSSSVASKMVLPPGYSSGMSREEMEAELSRRAQSQLVSAERYAIAREEALQAERDKEMQRVAEIDQQLFHAMQGTAALGQDRQAQLEGDYLAAIDRQYANNPDATKADLQWARDIQINNAALAIQQGWQMSANRPQLQGSPLGQGAGAAIQALPAQAAAQSEILGQIRQDLHGFLSTNGATLETTIHNNFAPSATPQDVEQAVINAQHQILVGLQQRRGLG